MCHIDLIVTNKTVINMHLLWTTMTTSIHDPFYFGGEPNMSWWWTSNRYALLDWSLVVVSNSHMPKIHSKPLKYDFIGTRLCAQPSVCLCMNNSNFRSNGFFSHKRISSKAEVKFVFIGIGCQFCVDANNCFLF